MKTINEASLENSKLHYIMAFSEELHEDADMDFKAGVEFAQQWIPIEEELPENFSSILVRDNGISPIRSTALFQDGEFFPDFLLEHEQVTHWRPIDLK